MPSVLYLYDPLCGWCYAATPGIERLRAAGVTVDLLPTGLFSDPGRVMTAGFAEYVWKNDQRIAAMTGQVFTDAYRRQVLRATGATFDSTATTLALTAAALDNPTREADVLRLVQEARYRFGRDVTDVETLRAVLVEAGLSAAAASLKSPSPALLSANAARVARGAGSVRELGGRGVPTLALVEGSTRRLLDGQLLYGPSETLLAPFDTAAPTG